MTAGSKQVSSSHLISDISTVHARTHFTRNPSEAVLHLIACSWVVLSEGFSGGLGCKMFSFFSCNLCCAALSEPCFKHLRARITVHTKSVYCVRLCIMEDDEGVINGLYAFLVLRGIFPSKWFWLLWVWRSQVLPCCTSACACLCVRVSTQEGCHHRLFPLQLRNTLFAPKPTKPLVMSSYFIKKGSEKQGECN